MDLVRLSIRQPVTVTVGVVMVLLAGILALRRIPIQLTPNVEDTVVAVTTRWEGASPSEVEQNLVDPQEERLQGITGLKRIVSSSQQGVGTVRLEFDVGTPKDLALREVSDKLREVPSYPENVDEPVVEASDPENRDYIAWFVFDCSDPAIDVRKQQDFAEDRMKPMLERVPGVSEVNVLGGRERETQVRFDPERLAQVGVPIHRLAAALRLTNDNWSAGALDESNAEVRVRMVSQFSSVDEVLDALVVERPSGSIYVRDVADVVETFKEPTGFVRSRGRPVIAINAQREVGANVMEVMEGLREAVATINADGGLLDSYGRQLGIEGEFTLEQVYDQTQYIDDALALVRNNIWIGGGLAIIVLLLFLRSVRSPAIVALSIPISVVGAVVFLVTMGRSVNVVSLAGMAFAVGMVVDNAIVVLENIFRHMEMGKAPARAAYDGAREVFGAVVAATLTTVVVFLPILLIEEEAGQLFRDIALAIVAAVLLSLLVSVTVIPSASARILKPLKKADADKKGLFGRIPDAIAGLVDVLSGSVLLRLLIVAGLTAVSLVGTWWLLPPADYLPVGNRNLIFGIIVPPPGMSVDQQEELGLRAEEYMRPFFEAGRFEPGTPEYEKAKSELEPIPTFDFATMSPGEPIEPPPLQNYFLVAFPGAMFHGGIGAEPERAADLQPLFQHATRGEVMPGTLAFAFQVPLFRLGGRSGSAVEINFSGEDLKSVTNAARSVYIAMVGQYGPFSLQPDPSNFDLPTPELQLEPDLERLGEVGMTPTDLGVAVQALGDGAFLGDYVVGSQTIDLKLIAADSLGDGPLERLGEQPIATNAGIVPLSSLATLQRVDAPGQINRTGRRRSVSLQFTPPTGMPLGEAMASVSAILADGRATGSIAFDVETTYSGSASKLDAVTTAMLGDGTFAGTLGSSLVLAILVVYLLMCVLFQSFMRPLIILFSVPLATLGGFAALAGIHVWSEADRHMPVQNLDVLTMLGFVILIGIVVNNAILIVHQSIQFMKGTGDEGPLGEPLPPRQAIVEAVRSRVRPIFMGMLTSVLGMSPLVFMPGAGSELYRGLGSVVVGGLIVSTVFTLLLVPLLMSLVSDLQAKLGILPERGESEEAPRAAHRGAAATATLLLVALLLPGLGSCSSSAPPRRSAFARAEDVLRAEMARIDPAPEQAAVRSNPDRAPDLPEEIGGRRDELERLGGPASWDVEVDLGDDLQGEATTTRPLALTDAVDAALASNLGLEIVRLRAGADREGVVVEDAAFDTVAFSTLEGESARTPNRVPLIITEDPMMPGVPVVTRIGAPRSEEDRVLGELGVRQLLRSGSTVSMSAFLELLDSHTEGIDYDPDPAWRSGVALEFTQPLMRGRGRDVAGAPLALAETQAERSAEDLAAEGLVLAALTEQAYWDLAEAWAGLRIRRHLVDQIAGVEAVLRERLDFDADRAAYSDALATLRNREAGVVRARRLVKAASDNLKALMDASFAPVASELVLQPADTLTAEAALALDPEVDLPLGIAIAGALDRRPEVRRALLDIEDADLRETLAADARRPRLDFFVGVSLAGLDDDAGSSASSLAEDDDWTALVGLALEQPIGARAGKAEERQARLLAQQSLRGYERVLRDVVREVKESLRDVQTSLELYDAARASRLAETENLRTILVEEESRSQLTPEFLALKLNRRDRLAVAQLAEIEALANTRRALAAYRRALGLGPPVPPAPSVPPAGSEAP